MTKELKQNNKIRRLSLYALSIGEAYAGASIAEQEQTLREFADGNDFDSAIMYKAGMCYLQQINRDYEEIRDWVECNSYYIKVYFVLTTSSAGVIYSPSS
jgi:hypothetical protein